MFTSLLICFLLIIHLPGRSQPNFPFKPGKAFNQNVRGKHSQMSLWLKAASFLGVGGGGGKSRGMPSQKMSAIFSAFFVHLTANFLRFNTQVD